MSLAPAGLMPPAKAGQLDSSTVLGLFSEAGTSPQLFLQSLYQEAKGDEFLITSLAH